jgi:hypothetical protein
MPQLHLLTSAFVLINNCHITAGRNGGTQSTEPVQRLEGSGATTGLQSLG